MPDLFRHPMRNNGSIPLWRVGPRHKAGVTTNKLLEFHMRYPSFRGGLAGGAVPQATRWWRVPTQTLP